MLAILESLPEETGKNARIGGTPKPHAGSLKSWSNDLDDLGFGVQSSTLVIWLDLDLMVGQCWGHIFILTYEDAYLGIT